MILVCPSCKATFKVPAGAIPPEGRKVRCAKCKHSWHATPSQALKSPPAPAAVRPAMGAAMAAGMGADMDAGLAARTAQLRRELGTPPPPPPAAAPADEGGFDEDDDFARAPAVPQSGADEDLGGDDFGVGAALRSHLAHADEDIGDLAEDAYDEDDHEDGDGEAEEDGAYEDDDFLARRRAEQRRQGERDAQTRMRRVIVVGWAALLILILSLLYVVTFERAALEEKWPASKVLYRWVAGANEIERLREKQEDGKPLTKPITETEVYVRATLEPPKVEERDGQMALVLKGYVENTGTRAANVPKLGIEITDSAGKVLDSWTFDPPGLVLTRGAKLPFEQTRSPIPIGAAKAEVKVLEGTRSATKAE